MELKNKRVLITGADGFIGSHLTELLHEKGAKVRALSYYNSFNNWGWLENTKCLSQIEVVSGDVRDPFFCKKLTQDIDVVFHLAALIAIPFSYVAPQSYVETNIQGTLNMCQAAMENKVERFIHTSTSEVYGTAQYVPIDEKHPMQPQSPYSASKISADSMALSYHNSFQLPLVVARPFNTFGPRQSARAIIPNIISQMAAGKSEIQLGDVRPTRDFNYVTDTCQAFCALAQCEDAAGKTVNIGSGQEISILELFNMIKKMMGSNATIQLDEQRIRPEKSEVQRLLCDNTLLEKLTHLKRQHSLEDGIKKTIAWFSEKENLAKYKTHIYNV